MSNPHFNFSISGPQSKETIDDLMDLMEEETINAEMTTRPQRSQIQTRLYQAEEEEKREREKRAVKNVEDEVE